MPRLGFFAIPPRLQFSSPGSEFSSRPLAESATQFGDESPIFFAMAINDNQTPFLGRFEREMGRRVDLIGQSAANHQFLVFDGVAKLLQNLNPEIANNIAIRAIALGSNVMRPVKTHHKVLATEVFGLSFPHPIGLAAGIDKKALAYNGFLKMGAGFVEVGTITPKEQYGNEKPRVFRLREDHAVINRFGFNNDGVKKTIVRLKNRIVEGGVVGINIGTNKNTPCPEDDYAHAAKMLAPFADYIAVNVSSPNTPGLRDLQASSSLKKLLELVQKNVEMSNKGSHTPILVKISPDLTDNQLVDIVDASLCSGIDGLIISNTSTDRPVSLQSSLYREGGGLSGRPLFNKSTQLLARAYCLLGNRMPLVGVGGIEDAETAYQKILAGASLVQIYTTLIYKGPGLIRQIQDGLASFLTRDGFGSIEQAVGENSTTWAK